MYNLKDFFQSLPVFVKCLKKVNGIKCVSFSSTTFLKNKSIATFTVKGALIKEIRNTPDSLVRLSLSELKGARNSD